MVFILKTLLWYSFGQMKQDLVNLDNTDSCLKIFFNVSSQCTRFNHHWSVNFTVLPN